MSLKLQKWVSVCCILLIEKSRLRVKTQISSGDLQMVKFVRKDVHNYKPIILELTLYSLRAEMFWDLTSGKQVQRRL
jgi:hypothetical protein